MKPSRLGLPLLLSAVLAACAAPPSPVAPSEPAAPSAPPEAAAAPPPAPKAPPVDPAKGGALLRPSALAAEVKKLGIDLSQPLEKLPVAKKKQLMPLFKKALGFAECTGCHASGTDYQTKTRNVRVAREMWNHFVAGLRDGQGEPLFCDSCHDGRAKVLSRGDKEAVQKFMETEYAGKLARADKKEHGCATCHGDLVEPRIFDKVWGIPAK